MEEGAGPLVFWAVHLLYATLALVLLYGDTLRRRLRSARSRGGVDAPA
jgi:hypothetical protein